jgi:SAM-dependent methyltransferase
MEAGPPEVRALAERTLWLMKICRLEPANVSPAMAWWIAKLAPPILMGALGGRVPSITMEGRHRRIDDYLAANPWTVLGAGSIVLDIGCGFPPLTTTDTAARFPAWQLIGVDHTFDDHNGATLLREALKEYERSNLSFIQATFGEDLPKADAVRCMNVLIYYGSDFRARAESWLAGILRPGGLFLCGANGWQSVESRYSVYRNEDGRLVAREFAFSLDNVRPFSGVPWFTLHDGDRETWMLAKLVGILRSDESFRRDYDTSLDRLLEQSHILDRDSDGRLRTSPAPIPAQQWRAAYAQVLVRLEEDGFVDRAVSVLKTAGLRAWRNIAGHAAIEPLQIKVL